MSHKKWLGDDVAVSPVIGVMLMLVVTIIIAAVVSTFAGSLTGGSDQVTPSAAIDVKIDTGADDGMGGTQPVITFELLSGDPVPTKDLKIITSYSNKTHIGYMTNHTVSSPKSLLYIGSYYGDSYARLPYLNDASKVGSAGSSINADFGNFTWSSGGIMCAQGTQQVSNFMGFANNTGYMDPDFGPGSTVDIDILHIPSNRMIYSKEVTAL
jgi:FlaG/FlaF family flagellin (archaellin)